MALAVARNLRGIPLKAGRNSGAGMVSCKKCLSICPNVFGLNCLIGMSKSAADRDTAPIVAIAKMVAELTSRQDGMIRQQLIEQLMPKSRTTMPSFVEKTLQVQSDLECGTDKDGPTGYDN